jgi:hypothetical protein
MAKVYSAWNGTSVTTAAPAPVTTGTAVKTMIQLATTANREARIVEWSWEGDASAAATPGTMELLFHGAGAATVTSYQAGDIKKYDPNGPSSQLSLGVSHSGFTASVEGTPASGTFSIVHQVPPTSGAYFQYPFGREPEVAVSTFVRLRNKFAAAINATCMIAWEE